MNLSRILTVIAVLALAALPAAAQGKAIGKPAGAGKPATAIVKGPTVKGKSADAKSGTLVKGSSAVAKSGDHGKSGDHANTTGTTDATTTEGSETKGRGQLPLGEKIALNGTLKTRLDTLLVGSTLTYDQATTGWKNQGQLVAAMNAANNTNLSFASIYTEMVTNGKSLADAVAFVKAATPTPTPTTTTTTTTTTTP